MCIVLNQEGRFYTGKWLKLKDTYPFLWTAYPKQASTFVWILRERQIDFSQPSLILDLREHNGW